MINWLQRKKNPALCGVPFLKNQEKAQKMVIFEKWSFTAICFDFFQNGTLQSAGFFLHCNQWIKTLHLRYQTPPLDDFHFLAYNGFLRFFRPLLGGSKIYLKNYFQFYYGRRHLKPWVPPLTIEKDLAGLKARLTLVECFPVGRRGCGAPPE